MSDHNRSSLKIAIIGCGNMGTILAEKLGPLQDVILHDHQWERAHALAKKIEAKAFKNPQEVIENAQFILLAIKPQNLKEWTHDVGKHLRKNHTILSILAGTPLNVLKHNFPHQAVVRMMPNLAMRYGMGVIGMVDSPAISSKLKKTLSDLLAPLGALAWLKESQIDALTALTGSGPAFLLTIIEAMIEAGVAMGFQAKEAQSLILQMFKGCIALLENSGEHPAELKWQIASPNGTTIAGLRTMEKENVRSGIIETFMTTLHRAHEISNSHGKLD